LRILLTISAAAFAVLATPEAAASSFGPPAAVERRPRIDAIVVDARLADRPAIEDALRVRLIDRPVSDSASARSPRKGEIFGYVQVDGATPERASMRLLLSDGRAYVREIEAPASSRAREIAASVANLVAGIEDGAIAPTEEGVPLPAALEPVARPVPKPSAPPKVVPVPRTEWGLAISSANVIALGPPPPIGYAAGGGELRGEGRWRRGPTIGVSLRFAGHARAGFGLLRIRVAPSLGWAWRRGRFELHTLALFTVEPFVLMQGGRLPDDAQRRPAHVLLGSALRLEPTGRVPLKSGRSLRIGVFAELAGSAIPASSGGVARLRRRNDAGELEDLFRAGGLELGAGLLIGPWIPRP
jgi:hypothetical protein